MTTALPSAALDPATLDAAQDELVETLRDLIRIPSINPPPDDAPDGELRAAGWIADALDGRRDPGRDPRARARSRLGRSRGFAATGPAASRSCCCRTSTSSRPRPTQWTHDPFAGDVADGYVWGRGAVDMKHLVAMELVVVRMLAAEARAAGRDPASDPIPGLTRDVLFASTADEEAGGLNGIALDRRWTGRSCSGPPPRSTSRAPSRSTFGGPPVLPDRRRREGLRRLPAHGPRDVGPRLDAARRQRRRARAADRDAPRGSRAAAPDAGDGALPAPTSARQLGEDQRRLVARSRRRRPAPRRSSPSTRSATRSPARVLRALLRDTVSPNIVHAGVKYNVIPGEATIEIDCRVLPGTSEDDMRETVVERIGPDLAAVSDVELVIHAPPVEAPTSGRLYDIDRSTRCATTTPTGSRSRSWSRSRPTRSTPPRSASRPTASRRSASPRDEPFLERFHGVDERVGVDALRWGLPVLYDVVRRFCG